MRSRSIAIIGAGLGGLSASISLASRGYHVDVFEREAGPGGKAGELWLGRYRFDTGPSLLTMPEVFRELFSLAGEELEDHLRFVPLEVICRYFYPDGTVLDAFTDKERFASELKEKLGEDPSAVLRYLDSCRRKYELTEGPFLKDVISVPWTFIRPKNLLKTLRMYRLEPFRTMHEVNLRWFKDPRTVQLFDRYATYNGSSPYLTPATFNLIQHVEYGIGAYAVKGGIHSIPRRMASLAGSLGAEIDYGCNVEKIVTEGGKVKGIVVDGEMLAYDRVVSNSDAAFTYESLLKDERTKEAKKVRGLEPSSSGAVFYIGISSAPKQLLVNNIFFSKDYKREFDEIWREKRCPSDPTVYINITSLVDAEDAPPRSQNWFLLVNAPFVNGQDWKEEMKMTLERSIEKLDGALGLHIKGSIEEVEQMSPKDIMERFRGNKGSIYGSSSNNMMAAFMRPGNRSKAHKGLYLCGGSCHPGGGMPLSVLSGMLAADQLAKNG